MKRLIRPVLLALCAFASPVLPAAETKPSPPPPATKSAAKPSFAGQYKGTWKSEATAAGGLQLTIAQTGTTWTAQATFTYQGTSVPTRMKAVEVKGAQIQVTFDWDSEGTPAQSVLKGELTGDTLQGTYESKIPGETSAGTWTVTRV